MVSITLNHHQWEVLFQPDGDVNSEIIESHEMLRYMRENRLWTEMNDGSIQSGYLFDNHLRYRATTIPYRDYTSITVTETGQAPRNYYFMVSKQDRFNLYRNTRGLPYIFWDIADANAWSDEFTAENLRQNYVLIDEDGDRYDWEGRCLGD